MQAGSDPELQAVFDDLLDSEGVELYLRTLSTYELQPGKIPWQWVQEVARSQGVFVVHVCDCDCVLMCDSG